MGPRSQLTEIARHCDPQFALGRRRLTDEYIVSNTAMASWSRQLSMYLMPGQHGREQKQKKPRCTRQVFWVGLRWGSESASVSQCDRR